jgi:two-component system NtrC family sensor kinase
MKPALNDLQASFEFLPYDKKHYRDLKKRHLLRLSLTYLAPLLILSVYFYLQYSSIESEGEKLHLKTIAENQANTFDLFLTERLINLSNLINDPRLTFPPSYDQITTYLEQLQKASDTFVDIGYFDSSGVQVTYAGPYPSLEKRNYSEENWFLSLLEKEEGYIITDIYLGFRQKPHFTIAVSRRENGRFAILRATLDPAKIYEYMRSLEGANEVITSIVNREGFYQVVTSHIGTLLKSSAIVPPDDSNLGVEEITLKGNEITYAYSWLRNADWALIVQKAQDGNPFILSDLRWRIIGISAFLVIITLVIIVLRSNKLVEIQIETDRTRAQLEHAAKLASVGELAAGIAHEINNPLAAINEEAGLIKDLTGPEFGGNLSCEEIKSHLDSIQESVFRCRDITRKLMGFVRKSDIELKTIDINSLLDDVLDGLIIREMQVSNIEVAKHYSYELPKIKTDGNQLQQVVLNILNNSIDALNNSSGEITITTFRDEKYVNIKIADTGKGMTPEVLGKIFMPFFTTKEVGRGTGLGLSVSYGIVKNLGGKIEVESVPNEGSSFTIKLPIV